MALDDDGIIRVDFVTPINSESTEIEMALIDGMVFVPAGKLEKAEARIEALEKALIKLRDCDWTITLPDRMDAVRDIARQALLEGE